MTCMGNYVPHQKTDLNVCLPTTSSTVLMLSYFSMALKFLSPQNVYWKIISRIALLNVFQWIIYCGRNFNGTDIFADTVSCVFIKMLIINNELCDRLQKRL